MIPLDDPSLYINRELSWLEFNFRVLEEAEDEQVPLLERVKFLAIVSSNLDEFFMVRVGGLKEKVAAGVTHGSGGDKLRSDEQLSKIQEMVSRMVQRQYQCWKHVIKPALREHGIVIRNEHDLTKDDDALMQDAFRSQVFPVLTPLAVDPAHPFPHLLNKSLNLAVMLRRPDDPDPLFAVVQVPSVRPRLLPLPGSSDFVPMELVIRRHLGDLFPGMEILDSATFRVTRNSEFEIEEDGIEDLLQAIQKNVKQRLRGIAVRLEIEANASQEIEQFLTHSFLLSPSDVYRVDGKLDLTLLFQIHGLPGYNELRDPAFVSLPVKEFPTPQSMWGAIRTKDILLHHPYDSFKHVVDFIEAAADDEAVHAIKMTLYRTSSDSPIVRALQRAADRGKQVTAVIELKARLDEERNILWAKELEKTGVHVVYGFIGLKIHCKAAMVVRREEQGTMRRYVHLGTGNYNPTTARTYTDLGIFTANPAIADDVTLLFNFLTGYAMRPQWQKLIVAPIRLQNFMLEKIQQEAKHQREGRTGRIIAKINGLLEPIIVQELYKAAQDGVKIDIICRGICALRPGIPGVSENIRVISVIDRFLEHSRIFYFGNDGKYEVYIGSADWMDRNLSRRVEVVFPIEQADLKTRMVEEILSISLQDNMKARELQPDGSYIRLKPPEGKPAIRSQQRFLELALEAERKANPIASAPTEANPIAVRPAKRGKRTGPHSKS